MLGREDVWHPRVGAPVGNRNRRKHGGMTDECKELRHLIAHWRRQTSALLAQALREVELAQLQGTAAAP